MSVLGGVVYRESGCVVGRDNAGRGKPVGDEDGREGGDVRDTGVMHDKFYKAGAATTAEDKPTAVREGIEMSKERIVRVEWEDSCTDSGWNKRTTYETEASISQCESVGFILKSNRTQLTLFQSKSHVTKQVTELISIPRKCITKITELKE